MKRLIQLVVALVLLVSVCAVLTPVFALSDPDALSVNAVSVYAEGDNIVLEMEIYNAGDAAIDAFAVALAFLDRDGYQLYGYDNTLTGFAEEICNWRYDPESPIGPGETFYTKDVFTNYAGTAEIAVAVRYYHVQEGETIRIPESEWQWIWPGEQAGNTATARAYYMMPSDTVYDAIGTYEVGYRYYLLDDFNAYYYDKNQGGEWITSVLPDSSADNAGLEAGD
ncbi:MAG: hypothetical protein IH607_06630, partial [Firmicutes bacterium]|nr:hypothetical protein [Bacillota bacterium]